MIKPILTLIALGFLNTFCLGNQHYLDIEIQDENIKSTLDSAFETIAANFEQGNDTLFIGNSDRILTIDEYRQSKKTDYNNSLYRIWFKTEKSINRLTVTSISKTYQADTNKLPPYMRKKGFVLAGLSISGFQLKLFISPKEIQSLTELCFSTDNRTISHNTAALIDSNKEYFIKKVLGENWFDKKDDCKWQTNTPQIKVLSPSDWLNLLSGSCMKNNSLEFKSIIEVDNSSNQYLIYFRPESIGLTFFDTCKNTTTDSIWTNADCFYVTVENSETADRLYELSLEQKILDILWNK